MFPQSPPFNPFAPMVPGFPGGCIPGTPGCTMPLTPPTPWYAGPIGIGLLVVGGLVAFKLLSK